MTSIHKLILSVLAIYCFASCSTPIGKRVYHDGKTFANRALDIYEAQALRDLNGFAK